MICWDNLLWILNESNSTHINWSIFGAKWKHIRGGGVILTVMLYYLIQLFDQLQMALDTSQAKHNPPKFQEDWQTLVSLCGFLSVPHLFMIQNIQWYDRTQLLQLLYCFLSNLLIKSIDCFGSKSAQPICPKFVVKYLCKHCWNNARQILSG